MGAQTHLLLSNQKFEITYWAEFWSILFGYGVVQIFFPEKDIPEKKMGLVNMVLDVYD